MRVSSGSTSEEGGDHRLGDSISNATISAYLHTSVHIHIRHIIIALLRTV